MTVKQLIGHLQQLETEGHGDTQVHFAYNYGDYWKTTVAPIVTDVEIGHVKDSPYHRMPKVVYEDDCTPTEEAVIIS